MTAVQNRSPRDNEQHLSKMEITGYSVFSASSDGADLNSEVRRSLDRRPKIEKGNFVYGRGDADICGQFLRCGAEEGNAFSGKINEAIGEVDFLVRQGPIIVLSLSDHSTWGTRLAHPSCDAVSAFRDLSKIDETRATFMLYPLNLPKEATQETRPIMRKLRPNEILFIKGSVRMEIDVPAGGSFVWQGNSGEPMGLDMFGPEVFEFMVV